MYIIRLLNIVTVSITRKKEKRIYDSPTLRLVVLVIFVSFLICRWQCMGCPGYPDNYLCRPLLQEAFTTGDIAVDVDIKSSDDYRNLVDLRNFTFLINVTPCKRTILPLLVVVHTRTTNFDKRATIRNTWASIVDDRFRLVFLLGLAENSTIQNRLEEENKLHGDIVQGSFIDAYRNLTYKHVMGFKWKEYFCPNVTNVLKVDDDVFVNLPKFIKYSETKKKDSPILCVPELNAKALRSSRSKWKVTWSEYKFRRYPTFCEGFVILYPSNVVTSLYSVAQRARYFWVDDVFVTGILAKIVGCKHKSFDWTKMSYENMTNIIRGDMPIDEFFIGPSNLAEEDIVELWNRVKMPKPESTAPKNDPQI